MTRLASVLALSLVVGCKSADPLPSVTGGGDNGAEDTAHTGHEPEPKLVAEIRFRAFVAWDATLGQVVDPTDDGRDYISAYITSLYEEGWTAADTTSWCEVVVPLEGLPLAEGVAQEGFLWGIDIPPAAPEEMGSDCLEDGFDPTQFDQGDPAAEWGAYDWKLRFGGELSADLTEWLTTYMAGDGFDIENYAAGGWSSDTAPYDTDADSNFWYARAMDAEHEIDFDTDVGRALMTNGNGEPITAYFTFDQTVYFYPQDDTE